jgi:hypothetical protein
MCGGQDRHVRTLNLPTVEILHLVIPGYEHPSVLMAKMDDFRILHVLSELAIRTSKPFMESLYSETCRSEACSDGLGCEAFVKE